MELEIGIGVVIMTIAFVLFSRGLTGSLPGGVYPPYESPEMRGIDEIKRKLDELAGV